MSDTRKEKICYYDRMIPNPAIQFTLTQRDKNIFSMLPDYPKKLFSKQLQTHYLGLDSNEEVKLLNLHKTKEKKDSDRDIFLLQHKQREVSFSLFEEEVNLDKLKEIILPDELQDDYYTRLLDVSNNKVIAYASGNTVFLRSYGVESEGIKFNIAPQVGQDKEDSLEEKVNNSVTCLHWLKHGRYLLVGTMLGYLEIWRINSLTNSEENALYKTVNCSGLISSIKQLNQSVIFCGTKKGDLFKIDFTKENPVINLVKTGQQSLCQLAISPDESYLASGGNNNTVHIWDLAALNNQSKPIKILDHYAGVRAMDWYPYSIPGKKTSPYILATGAGVGDKFIRLWDVDSGDVISQINAGSQVCDVYWCDSSVLAYTVGYSLFSLGLLKFDSQKLSLNKLVDATAQFSYVHRPLHSAYKKDNTFIVAAGKQMRFFKVSGIKAEVNLPIIDELPNDRSILKSTIR